MTPEGRYEVESLLHREALCLDEQRWDDWLALYPEEIEFWVPAWKNERETTADPKTEISLIYLSSRTRLEERVARIRSGKSAAALNLPRTAHAISNILVDDGGGSPLLVRSLCITHLYDPVRKEMGPTLSRYEHRLVRDDRGQWLIGGKKIVLPNDNLPAKLEFYMI